jgi:hypothetical protein
VDDVGSQAAGGELGAVDLRHADDAVGRAEHPLVQPVVEANLPVLARAAVEEADPRDPGGRRAAGAT